MVTLRPLLLLLLIPFTALHSQSAAEPPLRQLIDDALLRMKQTNGWQDVLLK